MMLSSNGTNAKLRDMIKSIRACRTKEEERRVVAKELAFIRNSVKSAHASQYGTRNVMKCIYLSLLGYTNIKFVHVTILNLVGSNRFMEKRIGYLGLVSVLLGEDSDLFMMVTNTIWKDVISSNQYVVGLALNSVASACNAELAQTIGPMVLEHLNSNANAYIVKRACTAACAIAEHADEFLPELANSVAEIVRQKSSASLLPAISLIRCLITTLIHQGTQNMTLDVTQSWQILSTFMDGCVIKIIQSIKNDIAGQSNNTIYSSPEGVEDSLHLCATSLRLFSYLCDIGAESPSKGKVHPTLIETVRVWVTDNYDEVKKMIIDIKNHAKVIESNLGRSASDGLLLEVVVAMDSLMKHYSKAHEEGNAQSPQCEPFSIDEEEDVKEEVPQITTSVPTRPVDLMDAFIEPTCDTLMSDKRIKSPRVRAQSVNLLGDDEMYPVEVTEIVDIVIEPPMVDIMTPPKQPDSLIDCSIVPECKAIPNDAVKVNVDVELEKFILSTITSFMASSEINTKYATLSCLKVMINKPEPIQFSPQLISCIVEMLVPEAWLLETGGSPRSKKSAKQSDPKLTMKLDEERGMVEGNSQDAQSNSDYLGGISLMHKSLDVIKYLFSSDNINTLCSEILRRVKVLYSLKQPVYHDIISQICEALAEAFITYGDHSDNILSMWIRFFSMISYGIVNDRYLNHVVGLIEREACKNPESFQNNTLKELENAVISMFERPEELCDDDSMRSSMWYNHPQRLERISLPLLLFYCYAIGMVEKMTGGGKQFLTEAKHEQFALFVSNLLAHLDWRIQYGNSFHVSNGIYNSRECIAMSSIVDDAEEMGSSDAVGQAIYCETIAVTLALSVVRITQSDHATDPWKQTCSIVLNKLCSMQSLLLRNPTIFTVILEYRQLTGNLNQGPIAFSFPSLPTATTKAINRAVSLLDDPVGPIDDGLITSEPIASFVNKALSPEWMMDDGSHPVGDLLTPVELKKPVVNRMDVLNDLI